MHEKKATHAHVCDSQNPDELLFIKYGRLEIIL